MIDIYIPSYKRPDAPLIKKMVDAGIPFTIVLDHQEDVKDYIKLKSEKVGIILLEKALGIGYVRQRIKDRYDGVPVIMLDDDTQLAIRDFNDPNKFITCNKPTEVRKWFKTIDKFCQEYEFDMGSAMDRAFNINDSRYVVDDTGVCSVTIFNSYRCKEIDYDPHLYKRMEDADIILQGITKHFKFLICNEVVRHCPMNKAAKDKGGCSEVYQNDELMRKTTQYLRSKWGTDIVTLRKSGKKIGNIPDFFVNYREMRKRNGYDY